MKPFQKLPVLQQKTNYFIALFAKIWCHNRELINSIKGAIMYADVRVKIPDEKGKIR